MFESQFFKLDFPTADTQKQWVSSREGEVRMGQKCCFRNTSSDWTACRFHILGIKEDIGPQLNLGRPGAANAFESFITRFLAVQSNEFLVGDTICIHGVIEPRKITASFDSKTIDDLDELVSSWTEEVVRNGGVPIVIGGGHNNAYPLIAGSYKAIGKQINVVNLDPHADTRKTGERHSGNPFSTAFEQQFLKQYAVLGLHESYNNQFILEKLTEMNAFVAFYESWLDVPSKFIQDIDHVLDAFFDQQTGVELDMDSIAWMPSSAFTPSGISVDQARIYIRKMARLKHVAYLHLPEAAPTNSQEELVVGKALAYLVTDFVKEYTKHRV